MDRLPDDQCLSCHLRCSYSRPCTTPSLVSISYPTLPQSWRHAVVSFFLLTLVTSLPVSASRTTQYLAGYKTPLCLAPWYGFVSGFGFVLRLTAFGCHTADVYVRGLKGSWDQNSLRTTWRERGGGREVVCVLALCSFPC